MPKDGGQPALFSDGELGPMPGKIEQDAFDAWNKIAPTVGWPRANRLTPERVKRLRKAVLEAGGLIGWRGILERASRSSFLTGKSGRTGTHENWRMDLEFICRPAMILKVDEGGFDDKGAPERKAQEPEKAPVDPHEEDRRKLRNYRAGGFWLPGWGPRPEQPGCWIAREPLAEWRSRHNVAVQERPVETVDEREAAMIASYRAKGRWQDANRLEQARADRLGVPAVLVPAPGTPEAPTANPLVGQKTGPSVDVKKSPRPGGITDVPDWEGIPEGEDFGQ